MRGEKYPDLFRLSRHPYFFNLYGAPMTDKMDLNDTLPIVACPGQIELPTPKERECLTAMRTIKGRVREIKKILRACLPNDPEKIKNLEQDLKALKEQWDRWEKSWQAAVRERMIYLGHEEPDE
jgi:hypothetical protein